MKHLLLGASICLGLFAFTANSSSRHRSVASLDHRAFTSDTTTKPKDTTKPNLAFAGYHNLVSDTTTKPKDTTKPNITYASYRILSDTTTKPKDTTKPNMELAMLMPAHSR